MYAIIETDEYGAFPDDVEEQLYLNHSCLNTMSFGSWDMAWTTDSLDEAQAMWRKVPAIDSSTIIEIG